MTSFPPEWDMPVGAVMLAWPHADTDWAPILDDADRCYLTMARAFDSAGLTVLVVTPEPDRVKALVDGAVDPTRLLVVGMPTNDTWTRDYGPIMVKGGEWEVESGVPADNKSCTSHSTLHSPLSTTLAWKALDYQFNGWGLKFASDCDNLVTSRLAEMGVLRVLVINRRGFVLEGGSIESDGNGAVITTAQCLLSPNRNAQLTREDIEKQLLADLGARKIVWLEHGSLEGDDTDGHVDTLVRTAPNNTLLYSYPWEADDSHAAELELLRNELRNITDADGHPYNLVELPLPSPVNDPGDGHRLPATYLNYLATPTHIFMPTYGQSERDEHAAQALSIAFPAHKIVRIDCRTLVRQHGSLHCSTMQLPENTLCI